MELWAMRRKPMLTTNDPLDRLRPAERTHEMLPLYLDGQADRLGNVVDQADHL
jgi:hypothetical protein